MKHLSPIKLPVLPSAPSNPESGFSSVYVKTDGLRVRDSSGGDKRVIVDTDVGAVNGVAPLDAGGKVPSANLPTAGSRTYKGTWNASSNTPTLASGTGTLGHYYIVSTAGTTTIDGISSWSVGDEINFNGTIWQRIQTAAQPASEKSQPNGYAGLDANGAVVDTTKWDRVDAPFVAPIIDVDFSRGIPAGFTFSRASSALWHDGYGNWHTATTDVPRYEFDPVSGQMLGMLIEGRGTTNLFLQSHDFSASDWTKSSVSASPETRTNKNLTNSGSASASTAQRKYAGASIQFSGGQEIYPTTSSDFDFGTGDFNISGWARVTTIGTEQYLFSLNETGKEVSIYVDSTGHLTAYAAGTTWAVSNAITAATWFFFSLSRSGTTCKIKMNAGAAGDYADYTISASLGGSTVPPDIGANYGISPGKLIGYMEDVEIVKGNARWHSLGYVPSAMGYPIKETVFFLKTNAGVIVNTATTVSGNSALGVPPYAIDEGYATAEHVLYQNITKDSSTRDYTITAYILDGSTLPRFSLMFGGASGVHVMFDTVSHTNYANYGPNSNYGILNQSVRRITASMWAYSVTIRVFAAVTSFSAGIFMLDTSTGLTPISYAGAGRILNLVAMQLEEQTCPTSYTPSTSTNGVRAPDILYRNTADLTGYSEAAGGVIMEVIPAQDSVSYQTYFDLNANPTYYRYINIQLYNHSWRFQSWNADTNVEITTDIGQLRAKPLRKTVLAATWGKQDDFDRTSYTIAENGELYTNGWYYTGGQPPTGLVKMSIGYRNDNGPNLGACFYLRSFKYYNERLPDSMLTLVTDTQAARRKKFEKIGIGSGAVMSGNDILLDINDGTDNVDTTMFGIYCSMGIRGLLGANRSLTVAQMTASGARVDLTNAAGRSAFITALGALAQRNNPADNGAGTINQLAGGTLTANHAQGVGDGAYSSLVTGCSALGQVVNGSATNVYGSLSTATVSGNVLTVKKGAVGSLHAARAQINAINLGTAVEAALFRGVINRGTSNKGTITNLYGAYLPPLSAEATNYSRAFFSEGTNDVSALLGRLLVGTDTDDTTSALQVAGKVKVGGNQVFDATGNLRLRSYTVATLPSAASSPDFVSVTDAPNGPTCAFSTGANWLDSKDGSIIV